MRVLIVEDNLSTGEALRTVLNLSGHKVMLARNVEEAKIILGTGRVDIAVVDWWLEPGDAGNGADVIRWARAKGIATPCVILTGMTDRTITDSVLSDMRGIDDVVMLHKPIDPEALMVSMREMVKGRDLAESVEGVPDSWVDT